MSHRMLLDTSSLTYRAFFALPASIVDGSGQPVNAVRGYLDFTAFLIGTHTPDEVVHCYDHDWKPAPRVAAYAAYKSKRLPDPPGLPEQFVIIREVLDALGMAQAEAEGWEAEDAIGTLCARAPKADRIDIVTGDRDLIQLVRDPHVRVLFTRKGVREVDVFDEAGVLAKYGVPAGRYGDMAILRGDPSDALPGVRGVGEKTARALVLAYPSLDALVADARAEKRSGAPLQRSAALRAAIRDAAGYIATMQEVVPIKTDLELTTWRGERDEGRLDELAERHKLGGALDRLRAAMADHPA